MAYGYSCFLRKKSEGGEAETGVVNDQGDKFGQGSVVCSPQPTCICGPHMVYAGSTWVPSGHGPKMGILSEAHFGQLSRSHMVKNRWAPYVGPSWVTNGK